MTVGSVGLTGRALTSGAPRGQITRGEEIMLDEDISQQNNHLALLNQELFITLQIHINPTQQ